MAEHTDVSPVQHAREKLGITRRQLADASGMGYTYLWNIEGGINPSVPAKLAKVLTALGVDVEELRQAHREWNRRRQQTVRAQVLGRIAAQ